MKIIKSSRRPKKEDSSSASENRSDERGYYTHAVTVDSSPEVSKSKSWKSNSERKPLAKEKPDRSSKKRSKFPNNEYQASLDKILPEQQFDFDTSNLEAMPKVEVFEAPSKGKTRRRSEMQAEKASEPLSLVVDPAKKKFNDLFARGLRLLAMREHSVKEITKKLFDKSEGSFKAKSPYKTKDDDDAENGDSDGVGGFDEAEDFEGAIASDRAEISSTIHAVIDDLLEKKYLSDERFTEVYIRSRRNRGFGPVKIKAELKDKGISNNLIQDYLDQGTAAWFDSAQSEYQKKYGDVPVKDYSSWTKRARFLQSRGFTMEQIHCTVTPVENY